MPRLIRWLGSILSGLALWACYPPLDAGWLVWVALVPLLAVLWGRAPLKARQGFGYGYLTGAVFFLSNLQWLRHVTWAGLLVPLYLALYFGAWGTFVVAVARPQTGRVLITVLRVLGLGAAWTGLEWLRATAFTGFGWNGLGVALHQWPDLAAQAEWIGVTGLSFWIVVPQGALALALMGRVRAPDAERPARAGAAAAVLLAMVAVLFVAPTWWLARESTRRSSHPSTIPCRIALVQPSIPQQFKSLREEFVPIARSLGRLTDQALRADPPPSLIVWPESSLPGTIDGPEVTEFLDQTVARGDFTLMLGIEEQLMDRFYNSVAVVRGSVESTRVHAKVHLVPFGEFLPGRSILGRIPGIVELLPGDFHAGDSTDPIQWPGTAIGIIPLVCFEDTIGRVARKFVRSGPQLMVNVTNDAWFKESEEADQHLANAVFRCIELRLPMVRAANTGVTALINAQGEVTARLPRFDEGLLQVTVGVPDASLPPTLYARHGDVLPPVLLALAGAAFAWSRRPSRSTSAGKQVAGEGRSALRA